MLWPFAETWVSGPLESSLPLARPQVARLVAALAAYKACNLAMLKAIFSFVLAPPRAARGRVWTKMFLQIVARLVAALAAYKACTLCYAIVPPGRKPA